MKIKQIHVQKKNSLKEMDRREMLLPYYNPKLLDLKVKLDQSSGLDFTENRKLSQTQSKTDQDKKANIRSLNKKKNARYFTIENEEQLKKKKIKKAAQKFESIQNIKKKIADTLLKDLVSLSSIQQSLVRSKHKNAIKISPLPSKKKSCTLDYSQFFVRYGQREKQSKLEELEKNISEITKNSRSPLMVNIAKTKVLTDRASDQTEKKQKFPLPYITNPQQKQKIQPCSRLHHHLIYELKSKNLSQQKKLIQKSNRTSKFFERSIRINKIDKKTFEEDQNIDSQSQSYSPWEINFKSQQHCDHLEDLMKNRPID